MMTSSNTCCAWFHKHGWNVGLLVLRLSMGIIFVYQGHAKLFGGMDMFSGMVAGLGFPIPAFFAWVAALTEFVGGIALLLGIATRIVSALLAIIMIVAIYAVSSMGFMMAMAPIALLGSSLALFCMGPGAFSTCRWMHCKGGDWCGCCASKGDGKMGCACAEHGMQKDACCKDKK